MTVWRIVSVPYNPDEVTHIHGRLEDLMNQGWEPFAVTKDSRHKVEIWLRKLVELDD